MDPAFWLARWEAGQIGFHRDEVNPFLVRHWASLGAPRDAGVFVPLCGKSRDLAWLAAQGHRVVGVEISPIAVRDFFAEYGKTPRIEKTARAERWRAQNVTILRGDYFELSPEDLGGDIAAVYDRAALIALPDTMRPRYVAQLRRLAPRAAILLVTLEYPPGEMEGPPFSVEQPEIESLYDGDYRIEMLESAEVLEQNPHLKSRGLSRLGERVYRLEPRGARPARGSNGL